MAGTLCLVGPDLTSAEVQQIEEAAAEHQLMCERTDDIWAAHRWMSDNMPAMAIVAKRMDGPCDAFTLMAMMKHGREPDLSGIPVIALGPGDRNYAYAAWCAGVDCYLSRPFNPEELSTFVGRILRRDA